MATTRAVLMAHVPGADHRSSCVGVEDVPIDLVTRQSRDSLTRVCEEWSGYIDDPPAIWIVSAGRLVDGLVADILPL